MLAAAHPPELLHTALAQLNALVDSPESALQLLHPQLGPQPPSSPLIILHSPVHPPGTLPVLLVRALAFSGEIVADSDPNPGRSKRPERRAVECTARACGRQRGEQEASRTSRGTIRVAVAVADLDRYCCRGRGRRAAHMLL
jgi:hypothetical protein